MYFVSDDYPTIMHTLLFSLFAEISDACIKRSLYSMPTFRVLAVSTWQQAVTRLVPALGYLAEIIRVVPCESTINDMMLNQNDQQVPARG